MLFNRVNGKYQFNMLRYIYCFLLLIFWTPAQAVEVEIASKRYPIEIDGVKTFLPYESSHNLSSKNDSITRVIYSIHSASYSAMSYFNRATALVDKVPDQKNKTLIIAPHILDKSCLDKPEDKNILYWEIPAFRGTSRGFFKDKRITVSAFEVTDMILEDVAVSGDFPNLRTIIILGHSAGGQMVNRYAASGIFETKIANPMGIEVRYIVMAPSSYVYFNDERAGEGTVNKFSVPKSPPDNYNHWGYGLERMYVYHKKYKVTPEFVIDQYPSKRILYLVGSKDRNENDSSMGRGEAAMLQGKHRLERGIIYYNYLVHFFGEQVKQTQHFQVIKGAGHSGRRLMLSAEAIKFTFSPNSKERPSSFSVLIREPKQLEEIRHGSKLSADALIAQIVEKPPCDRIDEYLKYLKPNILNSAKRQKVIRAFASSAQFLSPMYGRGSIKINRRQWIAYLSEGATVYPNNREIILTLTRMLIHQKRYKEALEIITPFYMSSPCHEATALHDYAIYKINGLTPSCNLMLEKTPEFDIHFCVITKNPKAHQKATLKQLKREVDILNKNFRTLRNEQIVKFKFKSANFYDEVKDLGCKFVDLGDAETYNTHKYTEVFNGCTHSKVRDRNAINFYVYDSYSKASGYVDNTCHGKRNSNRPYLLMDWLRLNCNAQSPEAHEMGHAFGLYHVSVPGARLASSTNIMCSTEQLFGSGGKRDMGFTQAQTAIILYHAKRTSDRQKQ